MGFIYGRGVLARYGVPGRDFQVAEIMDKLALAMALSQIPYEQFEAARPSDAVINPDTGGEWLCSDCGMGHTTKPKQCVKCGSFKVFRVVKFS